MVNSRFTFNKLIKLIAETWFYSLGIGFLFVFILTPVKPIGLKEVARMIFPISYGEYWFVTDYIMLMLISPLLNLVISKMDKYMHRNILIGATLLWSIAPTFALARYGYSEFGWFIVLYFFAAYIRKYIDIEKNNANKHLIIAVISYSLVVLSNILLIYLGHVTSIDLFTSNSTHFMSLNSTFILITSVELLIGFIKIKPFYNKTINKLATATLGVYLIHDNGLFSQYLWLNILKNPKMYYSKFLIVHAILSILAIYIVCSLIDLIRQNTFERMLFSVVNRNLEQIKDRVIFYLKKGYSKIYSLMLKFYN